MSSTKVTSNFFIASGVNLQNTPADLIELQTIVKLNKKQLTDRWKSQEGQQIFTTWKNNNFDIGVLDSIVGKYYDQYDLRGIDLSNIDLSGKNFQNIDFFGSNLINTNFSRSILDNSWFSECKICGTKFDWAQMNGVLIDNTKFDNKTSFLGINLNSVNFNLAVLLQDLALSQQRIDNLESTKPITAAVLRYTSDYGRSFKRFFLWCFGIVNSFAILYFFIPNSLTSHDIWDTLYFSALTFITGSFVIQPVSVIGKALALMEAGMGYLMTGLLVAILVKKIVGN
ncbi:pentapeptide repeat-containing protein [Pseudanabaena minima]|uniref:pentapeptide repeat-containing protein n=1 Tax=Pseudanabaena minima TaxID=890415 RepID=UPI003DA98239